MNILIERVKYSIQKKHIPITLSLIIFFHILILLQTVFWPATEFRILPYLTAKGLKPYIDIIDQHFPGLFFFPINVYTIGLANPFGLRGLQIFIVATTHVAIYLTTRRFIGLGHRSFYTNVLYIFSQTLFEGYVLWIDSFIAPFVLVSYLLLVSEKKGTGIWFTFLSGMSLSLALLFKQLILPVFAFVFTMLIILRAGKRSVVAFFLGFFIPVVFMLIYFSNRHIIGDFFYWTFIFNSNIYPKYAFRPPLIKEGLLIFIIVAPFLAFTVNEYIKNRRKDALLLSAYGLPLLIFLYGRYDFVHLQPFIPFACIFVSIWLFSKNSRRGFAFLYIFILVSICTFHLSKLGKYTNLIEYTHKQSIREIRKLSNEGRTIYLDSHHELYQLTNTIPFNRKYVPKLSWYSVKEEEIFLNSFSEKRPDVILILSSTPKSSIIYKFAETYYSKTKIVDDFFVFENNNF